MTGTFLGQSVAAVSETDKFLDFMGFTFQSWELGHKQNKEKDLQYGRK